MTDDDRPTDLNARERSADEVWLATLAGRASDPAGALHVEAAREARMLRQAMREWSPAVEPIATHDPQRIAALLAGAKQQGLLEDRRAGAARDSQRVPRRRASMGRLRAWWTAGGTARWGPHPWAMAVAVSAVVALAVVIRPVHQGAIDDDTTVRSANDAVTLLHARDPEALRAEIVTALSHQGVNATAYTRLGRTGIDADLPRPLSAGVKTVLDRYRIPAPGDGVLRVEIETERR